MDVNAAIAEFDDKLLLPLFAEIQSSARMKSKGRTITIAGAPPTGDAVTDEALAMAHGARTHTSQLGPLHRSGEFFGHTLVIVEPEELRASYKHPQAGRFYLSSLFTLPGDGSVSVSPWVFYWMRFNDKLHAFAHRYDNARAVYPIEQATRKDLVNHALNAISGFDIYAFQPTRPF